MRLKIKPWMEQVFFLLCIVALWPIAVGKYSSTAYQVLLGVLAVVLVSIFVRRIIRFRRLLREQEQKK